MKSTRVSLNENVIQGYHDIEIHGVSNVNSEIDEKEVQFNPWRTERDKPEEIIGIMAVHAGVEPVGHRASSAVIELVDNVAYLKEEDV